MKKADSPATTSMAYDQMLPKWNKVQTVLDGTEAMRAAGNKHLPQHAEESDAAYQDRLQQCTLFNLTKITRNALVGRPFSDPIKFTEETPQQLLDLFEDVDLQGTDVHVFARNWFQDGLAKAYSHVYVDFPRVEDGSTRTMADDRADRVRPYLVHLAPEQLIFADSETIDGYEVLREIRIMEELNERDGFAERIVKQIRRVFLDLVVEGETVTEVPTVELYQLEDPSTEGTEKEKWRVTETYTFDFPVIPLVTFYADRTGFMLGVPPLEDLANLNIAHWQSTSDQRAILTVARFPMLALSGGAPEEGALTIGPNSWLHSPDPSGKFYYVEHTGAAIEAGRKDLADLVDQMSEYGAEFLKKRPGGLTATARALDSAEATSPLQDMTLRFTHALNLATEYMAMWLGIEGESGKAMLPTEFGPEEANDSELNTLRETRKMRDISRWAYLEELMRRGLLSEDYNIEADAELLLEETMEMMGTLLPEEEDQPPGAEPDDDENQPPGA